MPSSPECELSTLEAWPRSLARGPAALPVVAADAAHFPARSAARSARILAPPSQHRSSSSAAVKAAAHPPNVLSVK